MTLTRSKAESVMISYTEVVTESSLRASISVGLRQLAKAIDQEDATVLTGKTIAQPACQQVGMWLKTRATTYDGLVINPSWFRHLLAEELDTLRYLIGEQAYWAGNYAEAGRLFNEFVTRTVK